MAFETSFKITFLTSGQAGIKKANSQLLALSKNLAAVAANLKLIDDSSNSLEKAGKYASIFNVEIREAKESLKQANTAFSTLNKNARNLNNTPLTKVKTNISDIAATANRAGKKLDNLSNKMGRLSVRQSRSGGYGNNSASIDSRFNSTFSPINPISSRSSGSGSQQSNRHSNYMPVRGGVFNSIPLGSELRSIMNVIRGAMVFTVLMKTGQAVKSLKESFVDANSTISESKIVLNSFLGDDALVKKIVGNAQNLSAKYGYSMDDIMAINKELITKLMQDGKKIDAGLLNTTIKTMMMIDKMSATQMGLRYVGFSIKEMLEGEGVADFKSMRNRLGIVMPKDEMRKISDMAKTQDKAGALKHFQKVLEDMGFKQSVLEDIINMGFAGAIGATSGMIKTLFQRLGVDSMEAFIRPFRGANTILSELLGGKSGMAKIEEYSKQLAVPFASATNMVSQLVSEFTTASNLENVLDKVKSTITLLTSLGSVGSGFLMGLLFGEEGSNSKGAALVEEIAMKIESMREPLTKVGVLFNSILTTIGQIISKLDSAKLGAMLDIGSQTATNATNSVGGISNILSPILQTLAIGYGMNKIGGVFKLFKGGAASGGAAAGGAAAKVGFFGKIKNAIKAKEQTYQNRVVASKNTHALKSDVSRYRAGVNEGYTDRINAFKLQQQNIVNKNIDKKMAGIGDSIWIGGRKVPAKEYESKYLRPAFESNSRAKIVRYSKKAGAQTDSKLAKRVATSNTAYIKPNRGFFEKLNLGALLLVSNFGTIGMVIAGVGTALYTLKTAFEMVTETTQVYNKNLAEMNQSKAETRYMRDVGAYVKNSGVSFGRIRELMTVGGRNSTAIETRDQFMERMDYEANSGNIDNLKGILSTEELLDTFSKKMNKRDYDIFISERPYLQLLKDNDFIPELKRLLQSIDNNIREGNIGVNGATNNSFNSTNATFGAGMRSNNG